MSRRFWFAVLALLVISAFLPRLTRADSAATKQQSEPEAPYASEKEQFDIIQGLFKNLDFKILNKRPSETCGDFEKDIASGQRIEVIEPIVKAESYDDPAFKKYHLQCPNLKLNHMYGDAATGAEAAGDLLHGMKGYMIDFNDKPNSEKEYVFYAEGFRPDPGWDITDPDTEGFGGGWGGHYSAADLKTCKQDHRVSLIVASSYSYKKRTRTNYFTLLILYKNKPYFLTYKVYILPDYKNIRDKVVYAPEYIIWLTNPLKTGGNEQLPECAFGHKP